MSSGVGGLGLVGVWVALLSIGGCEVCVSVSGSLELIAFSSGCLYVCVCREIFTFWE